MNEKINNYVNNLFDPYNETRSVEELKNDLISDLNERYKELIEHGKDEASALSETIDSIGDIEETIGEMAVLTHTLERQVLVNFSAQDLKDSDFAGVTLHNGKFASSAMKGVDFSGADLTGSSFKTSDLRNANFDRTNLTDCSFLTLDLSGASFNETILVRTNFCKSWPNDVKFTCVKFKDVNFSIVDMRSVCFDGCSIDGGNFDMTDLTGLCFDRMAISNVHFGKAYLKNVSFEHSVLKNVSFQPPFSISKKYYKAIKTIKFDGASMDKLTYNALRGLGADLSRVTVI